MFVKRSKNSLEIEVDSLYQMMNSQDKNDINLALGIIPQLRTYQHKNLKNKLLNTNETKWVRSYKFKDGCFIERKDFKVKFMIRKSGRMIKL